MRPSLRITGGIHRSRLLVAPRGSDTRPTADRVREALFSILTSEESLERARVLDLYAGTGALGIEALSRGAAHVTFIEKGREALSALRTNLETLGLAAADRARIVAGPVLRAVRASGNPGEPQVSLVLADPPYALVDSGEAGAVLTALSASGLLAPSARVVLEHASKTASPALDEAGLSSYGTRKYGDTSLTFYRFVSHLPP